MKIVRNSGGPRLFAALVAGFGVVVLPASPAAGTVAFAGECLVTASTTITPDGALGAARMTLSVTSTSCVIAGPGSPNQATLTATVRAMATATCWSGGYTGIGTISFPGRAHLASAAAVHTGWGITFAAASTNASVSGELYPASMNGTGCPTSWTGVMVVEDPEVG